MEIMKNLLYFYSHFRRSFSIAILLFLLPSSGYAFDYLEHSYFSDLACLDAQTFAEKNLTSEGEAARFFALSLFCPKKKIDNYCMEGYKKATSGVNEVDEDDFGITLGDLAALPDHVSRYGPIKNVIRAGRDGLALSLLDWLSDPGNVGGVIEDVAEDACEYDAHINWKPLNHQILSDVHYFEKKGLPNIHPDHLSSLARKEPRQGPNDPATKYTLDNPHYLDLVLRNHSHFGALAYDASLGFLQLGQELADRRCEDIVDFRAGEVENLAENLDLDTKDWGDMDAPTLARAACDLIGIALSQRIEGVAFSKNNEVLNRVKTKIRKGDQHTRDALVSATFGVLFRGVGLHFLQDGLAGGHLRTIRSRESLSEVRHDHDTDNRAGVIAIFPTATEQTPFIAFGDSYLLGNAFGEDSCENMVASSRMESSDVTDCLLRFQRALLVGSSRENLIDFVMDNRVGGKFAMNQMVNVPSKILRDGGGGTYRKGSLPVPAPTFSFESLAFRFGFSSRDNSPQIGLKLEALTELDNPAHWMVSYQLGLNYQPRYNGGESLYVDFAYAFHYRYFARVTLDFIPSLYGGVYGLGGQAETFFGVAPAMGFTFLPEGWIEIPLEVSIHYRLPIDLYSSDGGFKFGILEDHWVQIGFGLAFMH